MNITSAFFARPEKFHEARGLFEIAIVLFSCFAADRARTSKARKKSNHLIWSYQSSANHPQPLGRTPLPPPPPTTPSIDAQKQYFPRPKRGAPMPPGSGRQPRPVRDLCGLTDAALTGCHPCRSRVTMPAGAGDRRSGSCKSMKLTKHLFVRSIFSYFHTFFFRCRCSIAQAEHLRSQDFRGP